MAIFNLARQSAAIAMLFLAGWCRPLSAQPAGNSPVRLSEAYELANIILALTDYSKTDPWEVAQGSAYYRAVRAHFDRYAQHSLLTKVNYSRKEWENYLSFRTDAYAFGFDANNRLIRQIDFQANEGFSPFDEQLSLINDFAEQSGFRQFYRDHLPYYQSLATAYLHSQRYGDMLAFLEKELGKRDELAGYVIVLSPLVGRMNCHRVVAGVGTDFITLPTFLLEGKAVSNATRAELATNTHMLFTELDHAFVNPLTKQHRALLKANFNPFRWDEGSGYQTDEDSLATFNEYMTWAVYDLYVQTYFPDVAATVSQDWAMQNATRGFFASSLFNQELTRLYNARQPGQTIKDLYPAFIRRLGMLQASLSKPIITRFVFDNQPTSDSMTTITMHFSEPMQELNLLDLIWTIERQGKVVRQERVELTPESNGLVWGDQGQSVRFRIGVLKDAANQFTFNYPWKTRNALRSRRGVDAKLYSTITRKGVE